jgi:hypothetical protein
MEYALYREANLFREREIGKRKMWKPKPTRDWRCWAISKAFGLFDDREDKKVKVIEKTEKAVGPQLRRQHLHFYIASSRQSLLYLTTIIDTVIHVISNESNTIQLHYYSTEAKKTKQNRSEFLCRLSTSSSSSSFYTGDWTGSKHWGETDQ